MSTFVNISGFLFRLRTGGKTVIVGNERLWRLTVRTPQYHRFTDNEKSTLRFSEHGCSEQHATERSRTPQDVRVRVIGSKAPMGAWQKRPGGVWIREQI